MALAPVTHKPTAAHARQFDGTLDAFLDIIGARPAGLSATCTFDDAGVFVGLNVGGTQLGGDVQLFVGDWIVFPDDPTRPAFGLPAAKAGEDWQVV